MINQFKILQNFNNSLFIFFLIFYFLKKKNTPTNYQNEFLSKFYDSLTQINTSSEESLSECYFRTINKNYKSKTDKQKIINY